MESSPADLPIQDKNYTIPTKEELTKDNLYQKDNFSDNENIQEKEKQNNIVSEKPISSPRNDINEIQKYIIPISVDKIDTVQINKSIEKDKKCVFNISLDLNLNIRNAFMIKVYGILLTQFFITFGLILIAQIKIIKNYLLKN